MDSSWLIIPFFMKPPRILISRYDHETSLLRHRSVDPVWMPPLRAECAGHDRRNVTRTEISLTKASEHVVFVTMLKDRCFYGASTHCQYIYLCIYAHIHTYHIHVCIYIYIERENYIDMIMNQYYHHGTNHSKGNGI